jgi:nucleotide-binding universal stress UspA family protein
MPQFAERTPEPRPVVLGYDGSRTSQRALVRAATAAGAGGRVIVVTAVPQGDAFALDSEPDSAIDEPARLLEEAAARLSGYGVDVSTEVDEADPVEALVAAARKADAQLIVVGARGESYVARALRGSVGERLVSLAPCDVLVAR